MGYIETKIESIEILDNRINIKYNYVVHLDNIDDQYEKYIFMEPKFIDDLIRYCFNTFLEGYYISTIIDNTKTRAEKYKFFKKIKEFDYSILLEDKYYVFSKSKINEREYICIFGNNLKENIISNNYSFKDCLEGKIDDVCVIYLKRDLLTIIDNTKKIIDYIKKNLG